jgi:hypothetical protein
MTNTKAQQPIKVPKQADQTQPKKTETTFLTLNDKEEINYYHTGLLTLTPLLAILGFIFVRPGMFSLFIEFSCCDSRICKSSSNIVQTTTLLVCSYNPLIRFMNTFRLFSGDCTHINSAWQTMVVAVFFYYWSGIGITGGEYSVFNVVLYIFDCSFLRKSEKCH